MPVVLDRGSTGPFVLGSAPEMAPAEFAPSRIVDVALVNNMPDAALEATERQFTDLLTAASTDIVVRLKLYSIADVPRGEAARRYLGETYSAVNSLWNSRPDGLIVTGTEPRAAALTDEPYWGAMSRIVDWAQYATLSTIWSCLAAHAAVLRTDGISRHLLREKRSGVFACTLAANHAMTDGLPAQFVIPHSRCNDLDREELTVAGYTILSRSRQAGVDSFLKRVGRSTFLYFQGHPEYEAGTLFREYRRDVGRFLSGDRDTYPAMPEGYFGDQARARDRLITFRERALASRRPDLLADFPAIESDLPNPWRPAATQVYRNWLSALLLEKDRRPNATPRVSAQTSLHATVP